MQGKCTCVTGNCKVVLHNFMLFSFHYYLKCNAVQLVSVRKCDIFEVWWLHLQITFLFGWSLCLQLVMYLQLLMYLQLVVTGESTFRCSSFLRHFYFLLSKVTARSCAKRFIIVYRDRHFFSPMTVLQTEQLIVTLKSSNHLLY